MEEHKDIQLDPPRQLSSMEQSILSRLLTAEFPGDQELKIQMKGLRVFTECTGCLSIGLLPNVQDAAPAEVKHRIPIEAEGPDQDGVKIHFLLHVVDGFMNELEIFREDGGHIIQMPEPNVLQIINYGWV